MRKKILVVEDEEEIREIISEFLNASGYKVDTAVDGLEGYNKFVKSNYDLIIADIMMPKIDGFVLCEMVRKESDIPIILLTALDGEREQVKGFDLKIDDYITKPFSTILLLKRVESVLRRTEVKTKKQIVFKDIKVDTQSYKVYAGDKLIDLTMKEYELLVLLIKNQGRVLSREYLIKEVWESEYYGDSRIVDTHIKNLRKKLNVDYIETVRGVGYGFM